MANFLFLGEIVGKAGLSAIKFGLPNLKRKYKTDLVVANAEGVTGGYGIGKNHSIVLSKLGIDVLTGAEKLFFKLDLVTFLPKASFILRPMNYPQKAPGRYSKVITINNRKYMIINLQGNSDIKNNLANAFVIIEQYLSHIEPSITPIILFHASTTAEKNSMFHLLNGKVAAVIGTHTKVISADARVSEKGTAYITDIGRVGDFMSVGGFKIEPEIRKLKSMRPVKSEESLNLPVISGVSVTIDDLTGKAVSIVPFIEEVKIDEEEKND